MRVNIDEDLDEDAGDDASESIFRSATALSVRQVKGPNFFGFRTAAISSKLSISVFPAGGDLSSVQPCSCPGDEDSDAVFTFLHDGDRKCNAGASVRWNGIMALGKPVDNSQQWERKCGERTFVLRNGFKISREVLTETGQWVTVLGEVLAKDTEATIPYFQCTAKTSDKTITCGSYQVSSAARQMLQSLGAVTKHVWGVDFFGMHLSSVQAILEKDCTADEPQRKRTGPTQAPHPIYIRLSNIRSRGAGPTSSLSRQDAQDRRNETVHDLVAFASFGDVKSYVTWLALHHPELTEEGLVDAEEFCERLTENLAVQASIHLSAAESAELLVGEAHLSQRAYKALKKTFKRKNIFCASYKETKKTVEAMEIGSVTGSCSDRQQCMCALTNFKETLQLILSKSELVSSMSFPTPEQQKNLLEQLYAKYPTLYENAARNRPDNRTIFLRETGDNFRAAGKHQTQQDSFTILNMRHLITSPAGQVLNGLWRGPESRDMLKRHLLATYKEMADCVQNGLTVTQEDGTVEIFNVVVFYVADYSHKKEVLGRAAVTAKFGCPHCKKPLNQWGKLISPASVLSVEEMVTLGAKAERELGTSPDKDSTQYANFHRSNFGQTGKPLLSCFPAECNLACSLHLILALHRQLWKHVDHVVTCRGQTNLLPDALRAAGCRYMAFQCQMYIRGKEKRYDGNDKIKMTGEDCRLLECNIRKFVDTLCRDKPLGHAENATLKNIVSLYSKFQDLAKDLRSTSGNLERAKTFQHRVNTFIKLFQRVASFDCITRVMYVHTLIDHIPQWMVFWCKLMDWGYGVFTTVW